MRMSRKDRSTVNIDSSLKNRIKVYCATNNISIQELVNGVLREEIGRFERQVKKTKEKRNV